MSRFHPSRVSPPPRNKGKAPATLADFDDSHASAVSVPELAALSQEDVDFIEAVVSRAPTSATTFLTVFKAYNDILQERGLDPQNEVVYYGKLLKLGTLKGANWAEKWATIKRQEGYTTGTAARPATRRTTRVTRTTPAAAAAAATTSAAPKVLTRLAAGARHRPPEDTLTLHSHQDDTTSVADSTTTAPQYHNVGATDSRPPSPTTTVTTNSLGLETGMPSASNAGGLARTRATRRFAQWDAETSEETGSARTPSLPPSYGAVIREGTPLKPITRSKVTLSRAGSSSPPPAQLAPLRRLLQPPREENPSVVNEEEAWKKIKMAQDEKEADRFREEKLLERCWEVWKQGYQWIVTTHEQIAEARDNLILRIALQRWHERHAAGHELSQRVGKLSDNRCLKVAFELWQMKFKEKKQADWRNDMRARMKIVREHREQRLINDAWAKWRQSYRSHLSGQRYSEKLLARFFRRWKLRLHSLDQLDAATDHFVYARDERRLEKSFDMWRHALELRTAERTTAERVGLRVISKAVDVWKKRLHDNRVADDYYNITVMKRTMGAWKAARDRIRILEGRATKHVARQNDVLLRAIMRVWKAHERGRLLERVKNARLLKQAVAVWRSRLQHQRGLEDLALGFSTRSSSSLASTFLHKWRQSYATHHNAQAFALQYRNAQLQYKMLLTWRLELRAKLRMVKQAKLANKYFVQRLFFKKWLDRLKHQKLSAKLKDFEGRLVKKYLDQWLQAAVVQRERKLAEALITQRVTRRILSESLTQWTNRVADVKFRELETAQRYEAALVNDAFKKWKALCIRHVEELSLMESYQDVKREENMRKMFYRWLTAARNARHKRLYLEQKEEEMTLAVVGAAWDKWRERYQDIKLQPLADDFLLQKQKNIIFRAFGLWHSKTKSLPAVRFHATHTKASAWKIWRDAMPLALQARAAREKDRRAVLTQTFQKWLKAYKTKIELRAVARARYLRLPVAPRPAPAPAPPARTVFLKTLRPASPAKEDAPTAGPSTSSHARASSGRSGIVSLLTTRPRSPGRPGSSGTTRTRASVSPTRPKLTSTRSMRNASPMRPPSTYAATEDIDDGPARSVASGPSFTGPAARSTLWQELREIQLKNRAPLSERSRFREHPP